MNIEYHKWYSSNLNQDMELKVYGHAGKPVVVFPVQAGRFYDFENYAMIHAVHWFIDEGHITLYTVDSVDAQSWANFGAHPARPGCSGMKITTAISKKRWLHSLASATTARKRWRRAAVWAGITAPISSSAIPIFLMPSSA